MESLKRILADSPFLESLDEHHLDLLTGCASTVRIEKGEYLFHEGEEAERFFILRSGKVVLEIYSPERGPLAIQTLEAGDVLGWSWLVPPYQWRFDARAADLVLAISLDGVCLRTKCEDDHHLGYQLLKRFTDIMDQRLEATRVHLVDVHGTPA